MNCAEAIDQGDEHLLASWEEDSSTIEEEDINQEESVSRRKNKLQRASGSKVNVIEHIFLLKPRVDLKIDKNHIHQKGKKTSDLFERKISLKLKLQSKEKETTLLLWVVLMLHISGQEKTK